MEIDIVEGAAPPVAQPAPAESGPSEPAAVVEAPPKKP